MNISREWMISDSLKIAMVTEFPPEAYRRQADEFLLKDYPFLPWHDQLSDSERNQLKTLGSRLSGVEWLRLALFEHGELAGWSLGCQDSSTSFFMLASAIRPDLRRQGLYSRMLQAFLEITREKGYQFVSSCHALTNNPVIIAKLKAGFTIKGIEVDAVYGTAVRLVFHHNDLMKSAARFRAGAVGEKTVRDLLIGK